MDSGDTTFAFTIVARNYLGQASVLFNSILKQCSNVRFCCFVADGFDNDSEIPEELRNSVFDCRKLGIPYFEEMAFRYDVVEFSTSLKPYIFRYILEVEGHEKAVYFDPDIKLFHDLSWLDEALSAGSIAVTPHVIHVPSEQSESSRMPAIDMREFLFVGAMNFGFIAIRKSETGLAMLKWWAKELRDKCFVEIGQSLFVDQKWGDLLPGFFAEEVVVVRDPGTNLAYWNMHERELAGDAETGYLVNGAKLKFVHFSSVDLANSEGISSNIPKSRNINLVSYPEYTEIFSTYKRELIESGHLSRKKNTPYRYNYFENGETINKLHRRIFSRLSKEENLGNPFSATGNYYLRLKKAGLLDSTGGTRELAAADVPNLKRKRGIIEFGFTILRRVLGTQRYIALLNEVRRIANLENNVFLLK